MKYSDLRDFISKLQQLGELKHVSTPVSPVLEMTEICDRTLRAGGPALLFDQPQGHKIPVLGNLFGTPRRVARAVNLFVCGRLRWLASVVGRVPRNALSTANNFFGGKADAF